MGKEELSYTAFCKEICNDYGIDPIIKIKRPRDYFKDERGNFKISSPSDSVIVDKDGNEFPYMKSTWPAPVRNEEKLIDFDHIYFLRPKNIDNIEGELNINIAWRSCKISEGGGWYRHGKKYFHKNYYCEV